MQFCRSYRTMLAWKHEVKQRLLQAKPFIHDGFDRTQRTPYGIWQLDVPETGRRGGKRRGSATL